MDVLHHRGRYILQKWICYVWSNWYGRRRPSDMRCAHRRTLVVRRGGTHPPDGRRTGPGVAWRCSEDGVWRVLCRRHVSWRRKSVPDPMEVSLTHPAVPSQRWCSHSAIVCRSRESWAAVVEPYQAPWFGPWTLCVAASASLIFPTMWRRPFVYRWHAGCLHSAILTLRGLFQRVTR